MKKFTWAMIMFAVCLLGMKGTVSAAGTAEVAVKGEAFSKGTTNWSATCELNSSTSVTNGKIRITYDGSKLKLLSSEAGALLNGALPEINDPVNGNKAEGEIVLVFASSGQIDASGVLLNLNFQVMDTVNDGDEIQVSVKTEELISGGETVEAKDIPLAFAVGGSVKAPEENTGDSQNTGNGQEQSESESKNEDTSKGGNSGQNGDSTGTGNTSAQNGGNTEAGNSGGTATSAKTGDTTNVVLPAVGAVLALLVLAGLFFWKKKSPRR